jgi:hypothetical protein
VKAVGELLDGGGSDRKLTSLGFPWCSNDSQNVSALYRVFKSLKVTFEGSSVPEKLNFGRVSLQIDKHEVFRLFTNIDDAPRN